MTGLFCIRVVVVGPWIYTFVKTHRTDQQNKTHFTVVNLKIKKKREILGNQPNSIKKKWAFLENGLSKNWKIWASVKVRLPSKSSRQWRLVCGSDAGISSFPQKLRQLSDCKQYHGWFFPFVDIGIGEIPRRNFLSIEISTKKCATRMLTWLSWGHYSANKSESLKM